MKSEVPTALTLLRDWSVWLVSLQTAALGVASFVVGKGEAFNLNAPWLKLSLILFALSIIFATFVLAALPDIALRIADVSAQGSATRAVNFYHLPIFDQGRWSPFWYTPLWLYTLGQHVFFGLGLACVVAAVVLGGKESDP